MSKLIVEVSKIISVEKHPNADLLDICKVRGWSVIVQKNSFKVGDLCIYFPPDSLIPSSIYNGRLNVSKYLHDISKDLNLIDYKRVVATRLRGIPSFGLIMPLDFSKGDDPNWVEGTDVLDYFEVKKYDPPVKIAEGEVEIQSSKFFDYTSIENIKNYPNAIKDGTDVVITEKIHGSNSRIGLVLESDENGNPIWTKMGGSHSLRRREWVDIETRFRISALNNLGINLPLNLNDVILVNNKYWRIKSIVEPTKPEDELKFQCLQVDENNNLVKARSQYWTGLTSEVDALLSYLRDAPYSEEKYSIIIYGEIYGLVQDMKYGLNSIKFRAFDIAINNKYLSFDEQQNLFSRFNVDMVPILYRGPFTMSKVEELTSGDTTLCPKNLAGNFSGREGIVIKPTTEIDYSPIINGRCILKSISADYLARKGGTEYH